MPLLLAPGTPSRSKMRCIPGWSPGNVSSLGWASTPFDEEGYGLYSGLPHSKTSRQEHSNHHLPERLEVEAKLGLTLFVPGEWHPNALRDQWTLDTALS